MHREAVRVCPADHPALAGHFPGNPIVPGVVLLEEVFLAAAAVLGDIELAGFPSVKFLSPLRPGEPFTVCLTMSDPAFSDDPAEVGFACTCGGRTISQGRMAIRRRAASRPAADGAVI